MYKLLIILENCWNSLLDPKVNSKKTISNAKLPQIGSMNLHIFRGLNLQSIWFVIKPSIFSTSGHNSNKIHSLFFSLNDNQKHFSVSLHILKHSSKFKDIELSNSSS